MTPDASDDEVRELALKLSALCARERGTLTSAQLYLALARCIRDIVRSCNCPRCHERILRHAKFKLLKELRGASEYSVEKYAGHVRNC
jgi:hypothetical protein